MFDGVVHISTRTIRKVITNGRTWRFDFHPCCGVDWVNKRGRAIDVRRVPKAAWAEFEKWFEQHMANERQGELDTLGNKPRIRETCCHDCAYRIDSPERKDPKMFAQLMKQATSGQGTFYCHQGMPRDYLDPNDYEPGYPLEGKYQVCAGWEAIRKGALGSS